MSEIITLTDPQLEATLKQDKPLLLLFSSGGDLRSDFNVAFKKAAAEHPEIVFGQIHPEHNPQAVERFGAGSKAVMIALYKEQELVRRSRPWGADVPLAVELLLKAVEANKPAVVEKSPAVAPVKNKENKLVDIKPVHVTDQTFQQEVIDYELPVLVDFWAEWCGPCRMVGPILDKLAEEYAGKVRIAKVDVDSNPGLSQAFQVQSIPTIMLLKNRTVVFSQPGALPEPAFRSLLDQLIALEVPSPEERQAAEQQEPVQE